MRDLNITTLRSLKRFLEDLVLNQRLQGLEWATFLEDISMGNKLTTMVAQRNYLHKLQRINETTPEIKKLASTIMGLPGQRSRYWEKLIMEQRIRNKNREISEQRRRWMIASSKTEKLIPSSKVEEYRGIKRKECNNVWVQ